MNLHIDQQVEGSTYYVSVAGEVDAYTAPKLKEAILPLAQESGKTVVVNLEQVNYMDSTGLGVFISALKSTKENDSQLTLVSLQDRVKRLFDITGLNSVIDIDSTVQGGNK
ncbi:anti-sigma factor antagonist [Gracilibacillus halophilus]|nr:anti-sigma factor antagonist [Gracilibacillus halophilus]